MADKVKIDLTTDVGVSGLQHQDGIIRDEYQRQLQGQKGMETYREMGNEPVLKAVKYAITSLSEQLDFDVSMPEIPDDAPEGLYDQQRVDRDFLKANMEGLDIPWEETISEALTMCQYGFSVLEKVFERRPDGNLYWKKLPGRAQETIFRWKLSDSGDIEGLYQLAAPTYRETFIPAEKLLLFRTTAARRNPEGESIFRGAYIPWFEKKHTRESRMIGIRRDLCGMPVIRVPAEWMSDNATASQKAFVAECKKIVTRVQRGEQEGVVMPVVFDSKTGKDAVTFDLMASAGQRQFDITAVMQSLDFEMVVQCLAGFITIGHNGTGSLALERGKTDMFLGAAGNFIDKILAVFNKHAVPQLFRVNGMDRDRYPFITRSKLKAPNLSEIGTLVSSMSNSGFAVYENEELERRLYALLGVKTAQREQFSDTETDIENTELMSKVGGVKGLIEITVAVGAGEIAPDSAVVMVQKLYGFDEETARSIVGKAIAKPATE